MTAACGTSTASQVAPGTELAVARRGTIQRVVHTPGILRFTRPVPITFGASGIVAEVRVGPGDIVVKGQALAELDKGALEDDVATARQALSEARLALLLERGVDRSALVAEGAEAVAQARLALGSAVQALNLSGQPASNRDRSEAEQDVARARVHLLEAESELEQAASGGGPAVVREAEAEVLRLEAVLDTALAEQRLAETSGTMAINGAESLVGVAEVTYRDSLRRAYGLDVPASVDLAPPAELLESNPFTLREPVVGDVALAASLLEPFSDLGIEWPPGSGTIPTALTTETVAIPSDVQTAWSEVARASANLETARFEVGQAAASSRSEVARVQREIASAQEAVAAIADGPDPREVELNKAELALAEAALRVAEAALEDLGAGPDPLHVALKEAEVATAEAALAKAEAEMALRLLPEDEDPVLAPLLSRVRVAERSLDEAMVAVERSALVAPFDGIVSVVRVEVGDRVSTDDISIVMVDPAGLELASQVDAEDVLLLRQGQPATVLLEHLPGADIPGVVGAVAPVPHEADGTLTYEVRIEVRPHGLSMLLREGLGAVGTIVVEERQDALLLPTGAVYENHVGLVTEVVLDNGTTEERPVRLGIVNGSFVEVIQGVYEGELVVVRASRAAQLETLAQPPRDEAAG